jgi:hypothetical protein
MLRKECASTFRKSQKKAIVISRTPKSSQERLIQVSVAQLYQPIVLEVFVAAPKLIAATNLFCFSSSRHHNISEPPLRVFQDPTQLL